MSEWIKYKEQNDGGGYRLELRRERDSGRSVIRLLYLGDETARGIALDCLQLRAIPGIEPLSGKKADLSIHDAELDWIAAQLGLPAPAHIEDIEESDDAEEESEMNQPCVRSKWRWPWRKQ